MTHIYYPVKVSGARKSGLEQGRLDTMTNIAATYIDHMGSDLSVVNAARVSFGKKSHWVEGHKEGHPSIAPVLAPRDEKLIQYLAQHKHLSPFGHAFASFHVKAPIFVARQLVKHKFLRWNEISRRYVSDEPEIYLPDEWRMAADDVKQGSSDKVVRENASWRFEYLAVCREAVEQYNYMVREGIAPEQARMILPQATMTEWYWSGSLDAFASMCKLRCAPDTQYESRIVADQISSELGKLYPISWNALMGA